MENVTVKSQLSDENSNNSENVDVFNPTVNNDIQYQEVSFLQFWCETISQIFIYLKVLYQFFLHLNSV